MPKPLFFSIDGLDGVGKSTQIRLFTQWLRDRGHTVITCRDPGSTRLGEQLRAIVLGTIDTPIDPRSETLLYMAARAQLVHEVIRPALNAGHVVVSDRYLLANVVYQGYGFSLPVDLLWQVGEFATGGLVPDKTICLDLDVDAAKARRKGAADRMEQRDTAYFQRLREGFLTEARRQPDRVAVVDAQGEIADVQQSIRDAVRDCL
jgi:dTMP kinase